MRPLKKDDNRENPRPLPALRLVVFFLLSLFLAQWNSVFAFTETPVISVSELEMSQNITPYAKTLESNRDSLDPKNINQPHIQNHFEQVNEKTLHKGFTSNPVWLKFGLYNNFEDEQTIYLEVNQLNPSELEIYKENEAGNVMLYISPPTGSLEKLGPPLQRFTFPLYLAPGENSIFYLKLRADFPVNARLILHNQAFNPNTSNDYFIMGIMISGLFLLTLTGIILYAKNHAPPVLYFFLLTGALGAYLVFCLEEPRRTLVDRGITQHADVLTIITCIALLLLYTWKSIPGEFISESRRKSFIVLAGAFFPCLAFLLFTEIRVSHIVAVAYSVAALIFCFYAVLVAYFKGSPGSGWILNGFTVITIIGVMDTLVSFNLLPFSMASLWISVIASGYFILSLFINVLNLPGRTPSASKPGAAGDKSFQQMQDEYISDFSHQVRTPLSGIMGMAELLQDSNLTPNQKYYLSTIRSSTNLLSNIINEVVDGFRLETGNITLNNNPFEIRKLVQQCADIFQDEAEERNIDFSVFIEPSLPELYSGDEGRIKQIIYSAINAVMKSSRVSRVQVNVKPVIKAGQTLQFEIGNLQSLLDREQHPGSTLPVYGMKTAERLVDALGGDCGIISNADGTSGIWISLPLEQLEGGATPDLIALVENMRMLVVDDDPTVTRIIAEQGRNWGMDVTTVENPKEALALARNQANINEAFDIILIDHEMPDMGGLQLTARLREDPLISNEVIIIMLTGLSIAPSATTVRNAGIRRILTKPVTGDSLLIAIAEEIQHASRVREQARAAMPESREALIDEPIDILVAEDHRLSQKVIRGMLNRLGAGFDLVENGKEAVAKFKEKHYDMVLMDCEMPEMNGYQATEEIRDWEKAEHRQATPIIALTAHILDNNEKLSLKAGMNSYISKPIELGELNALVTRWTGKRTREITD